MRLTATKTTRSSPTMESEKNINDGVPRGEMKLRGRGVHVVEWWSGRSVSYIRGSNDNVRILSTPDAWKQSHKFVICVISTPRCLDDWVYSVNTTRNLKD